MKDLKYYMGLNYKIDYSGQFKLRIPKTLHKELAEKSKKEGISMNQYCLYLLSKNSSYCAKRS